MSYNEIGLDEMLTAILRDWDSWVHGSRDAYFDNWPDFLGNELQKRGLCIVGTGAISPRPKPPEVKQYVDVPLPLDFDDEVDANRVADILSFMQPSNEIGKRP